MKKNVFTWLLIGILTLLLTSCSVLPFLENLGEESTPVPPTAVPGSPTPGPTASPEPTRPVRTELILWVPPAFGPEMEGGPGEILLQTLDEFNQERSDIAYQVRVKALEGPGGMLESLRAAKSAAPRLLPDLVVLPREMMEAAAAEGLIHSPQGLAEIMLEEDWFPYAEELSRVNGQTYGVPFAGDVLVLAYKSDLTEEPLADWDAVLETGKALAFPAADPRGVVTLAFYQSEGGEIAALNENLVLDRVRLFNFFNDYQRAQEAGVMPYWLTQFEESQGAWAAYQERQTTLAVTWLSHVLGEGSENTAVAPFPTRDGVPYTYGTGWVFAFANLNPEREETALALSQQLASAAFQAELTSRTGYIPLRRSALAAWEDGVEVSFLETALSTAAVKPSPEVLDALGPLVRDAAVAVLKDQADPEAEVDLLLQRLKQLP